MQIDSHMDFAPRWESHLLQFWGETNNEYTNRELHDNVDLGSYVTLPTLVCPRFRTSYGFSSCRMRFSEAMSEGVEVQTRRPQSSPMGVQRRYAVLTTYVADLQQLGKCVNDQFEVPHLCQVS
jgi:hypothetical protein